MTVKEFMNRLAAMPQALNVNFLLIADLDDGASEVWDAKLSDVSVEDADGEVPAVVMVALEPADDDDDNAIADNSPDTGMNDIEQTKLEMEIASLRESLDVYRETLRDRFAMAALRYLATDLYEPGDHESLMVDAYSIADAALMVRLRPHRNAKVQTTGPGLLHEALNP